MRIHLIAIGGAVMHNLAIALKNEGHEVTGSDDEIYNPARDRLAESGLLPSTEGWNEHRITPDIDRIILGMHAHLDNPELQKAQTLGLTIQSFPEFIAEFSADKIRVVVAGSHGKTTTTSMIMHVLQKSKVDFDYLVGAALDGFEDSVRLSSAPIMIIEGDEYLSSRLDPVPKILHYKPQLAVITGIAWDHLNVFPTFASYIAAFGDFIDTLAPESTLFYYGGSADLSNLVESASSIQATPYQALSFQAEKQAVIWEKQFYPIQIFGQHNLENLRAAMLICGALNIGPAEFLSHIGSFKGAKKRLELLVEQANQKVYLDYAHSPSKVKATTSAVKKHYPNRALTVIFELHTYSSLNKAFLPQYADSLEAADKVIIFLDQKAFEIKRMQVLESEEIIKGFNRDDMEVIRQVEVLRNSIRLAFDVNTNYLLMSSGHFGGAELPLLFSELIN